MAEPAVTILVAVGSHRSLTEQELEWKVGGELRQRVKVECHDCRGDLAGTGIAYGERELKINRTFLEADLKVVIGSVLPHPFAGFSGGAKLVLPGLADLMSIQRSHQFVQMGLRGGSDPNENRFRLEAERIARELGLDFTVCVVSGTGRETIGVHAGDLVAAHRSACRQGAETFGTDLHDTYDCAVVNAFPKDMDLIQAASAFTAWTGVKSPVVREGGVVVLACAAPGGRGRHGLFEPGGVSYRAPRPERWLQGRDLWLYTPGVAEADVRELYWDGYPVYRDGAELMGALRARLPSDARVAVFPCGPMQIVRDLRNGGAESN
jgi:nickel-dependent lactate racemase